EVEEGEGKVAAVDDWLERGEDLLVSQVARSAEENQGIGTRGAHGVFSYSPLVCGGFLQVSTEPEPHGRQQFVLVIRLSARREALVERSGEDRHGHRLVDGGLDGPPPLARVR